MGSVWRARHLKLHSEVAVKFMDPSIAASPSARDRFEREARASAKIDYLHIARVHDYGIEDDLPYIVMELLRGESLEDRLKRQFRLPIGELVPIVAQIGKALRKAHDAGFVHRDLKPPNIFLVKSDDDEEIVKLLDFGIAKETDAAAGGSTRTGEFMGSPHYMSPEQIQDSRAIDHRSDLWALGVILFRAIAGALPFPGDTIGGVISKVLTAPVPSPTSYLRGLPEGVDAFFQKALARDRALRFQSAREMAEAFAVLAGASIATSPGRRGSSAPWIQRDALMGATGASSSAGHGMNAPTPVPPPRISEPGSRALPPPTPPPAAAAPVARGPAAAPVARGGKTIKMKPFEGPVPDPGPPKDLPPARGYTGTQPLSDGSQLIGTLTASPSARDTAAHGVSGGLRQRIIDNVRAWPLPGKIAAGSGITVLLLLLLLIAFRSPATPEKDGLAEANMTSAVAPSIAPSAPPAPPPSATSPIVENTDNEPVEILDEPVPSPPPSPPITSVPYNMKDSERVVTPKTVPDKAKLVILGAGGNCRVIISGRDYGSTPKSVKVNPGKRIVYCRLPNGQEIPKSIELGPGEVRTISFSVPPAPRKP